jgi:1-pyrroline-5-carboxylate dehydrogenase
MERIAPFSNEPIKTYSDPADVAAMQAALAAVRSGFGKKYPLVIDGERIFTEKTIPSINPSNPAETVGDVSSASLEQATRAIEIAHGRFETWKNTTAEERAGYLLRAAQIVRERRFHFNALMVYEVGKSWVEADATPPRPSTFWSFTLVKRCATRVRIR